MLDRSLALAEPLLEEVVPCRAWCTTNVALLSLLIGLGLAFVSKHVIEQHLRAHELITMGVGPGVVLACKHVGSWNNRPLDTAMGITSQIKNAVTIAVLLCIYI